MSKKQRKINGLVWILEPLESDPTFAQKKMFGCEAVYLGGRLSLVLADSDEPWNGLLVPTSREHHAAIQKEFKELQPHDVLGKWLYLSQNHAAFERIAGALVDRLRHGDFRFGVESQKKTRKKTKSK